MEQNLTELDWRYIQTCIQGIQSRRGLKYSEKFNSLAREHGLTPVQMALGFVNSRDFLTSNIIGATDLEQLKDNINSFRINLTDDVISEIEKIHDENPYPCP